MADILNLTCGAWLLPTDSLVRIEHEWHVAHPELRKLAATSAPAEFRDGVSLADQSGPGTGSRKVRRDSAGNARFGLSYRVRECTVMHGGAINLALKRQCDSSRPQIIMPAITSAKRNISITTATRHNPETFLTI